MFYFDLLKLMMPKKEFELFKVGRLVTSGFSLVCFAVDRLIKEQSDMLGVLCLC